MRTARHTLGLLAIASIGCVELRYADAGSDASEVGPADVQRTDTVDVVDAPNDRPADVIDAGDVTDASDVRDVVDAGDVTDASDVRDVVDASDVTDASDVRDVVDASDAADVRDAADAMDAADVTDAPIGDVSSLDMVSRPDTPLDVGPDVICAPGLFPCEGGCSNFCATPRPAPLQQSCVTAGTPGCGMAFVSAGSFMLGGDPVAANSTPAQPGIWVRQFYVDRYEVTVARFRAFAATVTSFSSLTGLARYTRGDTTYDLPYMVASPYEPTFHSSNLGCNWSRAAETRESHPMNCVTWAMAQAFCVWDAGVGGEGRLPTEAEWEWVARGINLDAYFTGRPYPWGTSTVSCAQANTMGCVGSTAPVGSVGAPYGVYDLIGNVYEWTADIYASFAESSYWSEMAQTNPLNLSATTTSPGRVTRGGGWEQTPLRSAARNSTPENGTIMNTTGYPSVGFRCVHGAFRPSPI